MQIEMLVLLPGDSIMQRFFEAIHIEICTNSKDWDFGRIVIGDAQNDGIELRGVEHVRIAFNLKTDTARRFALVRITHIGRSRLYCSRAGIVEFYIVSHFCAVVIRQDFSLLKTQRAVQSFPRGDHSACRKGITHRFYRVCIAVFVVAAVTDYADGIAIQHHTVSAIVRDVSRQRDRIANEVFTLR